MINSTVQFEQIHEQGEVLEVVDDYIHLRQLMQTETSSGEEIM